MGNVAIFKGKLVKFLAKAGILVPARGDIDRSASPTAGEMAFNTNANKLEVYNGTSWDQVGGSVNGSSITGPIYSRASGVSTKVYSKSASTTLATRATNSWIIRTQPEANVWEDICWSSDLNLFCAVASTGTNRVATSPNGITWTARTLPVTSSLLSVCWSPELKLFCAVGNSGNDRIFTSSDGITWVSRSTVLIAWRCVCWSPELGLFCAVSSDGTTRVYTSPDGINWTGRTSSEQNFWSSVCWSSELNLFCAVSLDGTNRVMTSPDGITWTARSASQANQWESVCWSPDLSLFCAVSNNGTDRVMISSNGINWISSPTPSSGISGKSICWSPELGMFYIASSIFNSGARSFNGTSWTEISTNSSSWSGACWSPELGIFCTVASAGTDRIMTSTYVGVRGTTKY
jgi:hypothetical protein